MVNRCPLVLVEWEDSRQPSSQWQYISSLDMPTVCRCVSVGFLLHEEDGIKVLAANMGDIDSEDDMQVTGVIAIPECSIKLVRELSESD